MGGGGGGGFRGTRGSKNRRQHGRTPMNNQAQNRQFDAVVRLLKLTKEQAEKLHREITGLGLGYQEILETAKELFEKE